MRSKAFQPHLKKKKVYNFKKKICITKNGVKFNFKNQSKKEKKKHPEKTNVQSQNNTQKWKNEKKSEIP